jgi:hypothetical protein
VRTRIDADTDTDTAVRSHRPSRATHTGALDADARMPTETHPRVCL